MAGGGSGVAEDGILRDSIGNCEKLVSNSLGSLEMLGGACGCAS